MTPIAQLLYSAIESGYMTAPQWRDWADRILERHENFPTWIIELSLTSSVEAAQAALLPGMTIEIIPNAEWICSDDLTIGFLQKMKEEGRISRLEMLYKAGLASDGGYSDLSPEEIYHVLNCEERGENIAALDPIFEACRNQATKAWESIGKFRIG
ncbi:MAG: hypothetical protein JWO82_517 [Akkermansiaceae bacterium]|nr:hypothetical protein [Akkermansiaceae bacterium]